MTPRSVGATFQPDDFVPAPTQTHTHTHGTHTSTMWKSLLENRVISVRHEGIATQPAALGMEYGNWEIFSVFPANNLTRNYHNVT